MRRRAYRSLALVSVFLCAGAAATRPRYGGVLTIHLAEPYPSWPVTAAANSRDVALLALVVETLVKENKKGEPEPWLAVSWQSDTAKKTWEVKLRPNVMFHDGALLTPALAAASLAKSFTSQQGFEVTAIADGVRIVTPQPWPDLPLRLSAISTAITRDGSRDGTALVGTGPFQRNASEGKVRLAAFEQYWGGRSFLDGIEFADPAATAAKAGAWEMPPGAPRRGFPDKLQIWASAPSDLLAIEVRSDIPQPVVAALSAAIDRVPMATVLTQRRAEPAAGLLPQWVSGYAVVLPLDRDLTRARQLAGAARGPLILSYDAADSLARVVAERIAVNARDAGLAVTTRADAAGPLRITRFRIHPSAPATLTGIAADLGLSDRLPWVGPAPEAVYAAERVLLESGRIVPLMHVPLIFGFADSVQLPTDRSDLPWLPLDGTWIRP